VGYRSDVALELTEAGEAFLQKRLQEAPAEVAEEVRTTLSYASTYEDSGVTLRYWEWIKWYEDYPDIAFIEATLNAMPAEDYKFIRLGEDYDDPTEIRGCSWESPFDLSVVRSITFAV